MKYKFENHCSDASLEQYALGKLAEEYAATLEEHLLICEICREKLDATERYVRAMKVAAARLREEVDRQPLAGNAKGGFFAPARAWTAAAAALCMAVLVLTIRWNPAMPVTPVAVSLAAERGRSVSAPAHRILDLSLDARGLRPTAGTRVELADSTGAVLETNKPRWSGDRIFTRISRDLPAGMYYVRLYGPDASGLEREFALPLK